MASTGNKKLNEGIPPLENAFVVLVKTEWNAQWVDALEKGAKQIFKTAGTKTKTLTVPGAVELCFAVRQHYAYAQKLPDAYVVLGAVIQGDTPHFDYVCRSVTDGVTQLNLQLDVPVIFGVLTVLNETQIKERLGGSHGHKGQEAAITALKMIQLNRSLHP